MENPPKPFFLEIMLLGSSLANLARFGSAQRELQYYELIAQRFHLVLFEYAAPIDGATFSTIPPASANKWINSIVTPLLQMNRLRGPGVIRSKQLWGSWSAWIFSRLKRKKFVLRCGYIWSRSVLHEHPALHPFARWIVLQLERLLVRRADALIYASVDIASYYRRFSHRPSVVIPNGFDTDRFRPKPEIPRDFDFAYTGRLIPLKGIGRMLEMVGPSRTVIIAGSGPLAGMIVNRNNITYLGVVPNQDLPDVLNRARFFISLSSTEGSPKCLIEAVLCGLYPIMSDIPAHRLLAEELGYGLLLCDGQQLDDDLTKLIVEPAKLERFRERYSLNSIVSSELSFCAQFVQ